MKESRRQEVDSKKGKGKKFLSPVCCLLSPKKYLLPTFKKEAGFTMVELLITMVVFVFVMAAASQIFSGLLTQFKQQSKIAETNIEGIVGLEILRQDIEHAGYGLPWDGLVNYNETEDDPFKLNDAPAGAPRAIIGESNTSFNGSDYLVIKSANVARNGASEKWTTLISDAPYVRTWQTESESTPASENLQPNDRVIVLSFRGEADQRVLVSGDSFSTIYSGVTSTPWRPIDPAETRLVYGIDPANEPRMPFNRADYFITRKDQDGKNITPQRCAPNTGVLQKALVTHSNGDFSFLPLLDCVADMQVIFGMDNDEDGDFEPGGASDDGYSDDISALTAQQIRDRVREVRVYILSHEGQRDPNFRYANETILVGELGLERSFDLKDRIGDPDYQYYRWKLYTIVVKTTNLR